MRIQSPPVDALCGVPPLPCAIRLNPRKRKRSLSPPSSKINTPFYHTVHTVQLQLNDGNIPSEFSSSSTLPDDQEHLKLNPECHAGHADPSIQHFYDTQSLGNLSLHQIGAGGGEGKSSLSSHPESPFEVLRRSKVSNKLGDQAMSKPSVSHLPPHRAPPAPPSPLLRPLPTRAFASTPHLPISLNARPCSFQDQQSQGLIGDTMRIDHPESKGPGGPHSQLPLSPAHKNSIEREPSANLRTQCRNQRSTRSQVPIMRHGRQQVPPQHGVPALQETGPPRDFNRPSESSGPPFQPDALGSQSHMPTALNHENEIKQRQGTHDSGKDNPRDEATGTDVPTNPQKRTWVRAARGPVNWDVSSYRRTPQPPSQLEVNNEMDCDDARKHRAAHSISPLLPWQALLMDFHPDLPISSEPPLKVELARGRRQAVFATAFESRRRRIERGDLQYSGGLLPPPTPAAPKSPHVPSLSREPPDTHQVLQEDPSPLHKEPRTEARLARSSLPLSMVSSLSSGIKPYISSESQVAHSLGKFTSSPSRIELKDKQDHKSTIDVPIEPEKHSCRRAIFQILQNSNSTLSDSSLSTTPFPASPATSTAPTRRRRPRRKPLSTQPAHRGRSLLSPVVRRRCEGVAAKATLDTSKSTSTTQTPPLVGPSQQAKREASRAYFNYSQTPRGSESLASIFDGDLSDVEEDRVSLSGAVPNSACSRLPETVSSIRLNMMWRTVTPVKVPQRHRERLSMTLKGIKSGGYGAFRTTNNNTARNAVLARAKKVEQGGISGAVSNPNVNVRSHEGQNIVDALLTLVRSLPEK